MNLFKPCFKPEQFDVVLCNGVLHHTADPWGGFQSIELRDHRVDTRFIEPERPGFASARFTRQLHVSRFQWPRTQRQGA